MNMTDIDAITCSCDDNKLVFDILCANKKDSHKYRTLFQKHFETLNHPYYNKYFDYIIVYTDFEITIELACLEGEESKIYDIHYSLL
jgi:ketosteroid isomerase-like protein